MPLNRAWKRTSGSWGARSFADSGSLLLAAAATALFVWLAARYVTLGSALSHKPDVWLGADLMRHRDWITGAELRSGVLRHPLSFLLYRAYGILLSVLSVRDPSLLLCAIPVLVALGLTLARYAGIARLPRVSTLLALATIGPLALLSALPESHLLGGLAFLWQLAFLRRAWMTSDVDVQRREAWRAFLAGACAAAFTLSNFVPATLVLLSLPSSARSRVLRASAVLGLGLSLFFFAGLLFKDSLQASGGGSSGLLRGELQWFQLPNRWAMERSLKELLLYQFGAPFLRLLRFWGSGPGDPAYRLLPQTNAGVAQIVSASLWGCALLASMRRIRPGILAPGAGALIFMVLLHAAHDPQESYLFAPHAWPFLVFPGILAFATEERAMVRGLFWLAMVSASIQSVLAIRALLPLLPYL